MNKSNTPRYSMGEEIFNAVTHGIGAMLALVGYGYSLALCIHYGTNIGIASISIYCFTLFFMFISSTCYHALPYPMAKHILRICDHCAIFLLIAGTYTPFTLLILPKPLGTNITIIIWISALIGVILNSIDVNKFAKFSVVCYVSMGWAIVFCMKTLITSLNFGGIVLLAIGGVLYTIGLLFYINKKRRYFHSVWHLFVLVAAMCHFYAILMYVMPAAFL